jgi:hypothetical protein
MLWALLAGEWERLDAAAVLITGHQQSRATTADPPQSIVVLAHTQNSLPSGSASTT